MSTQHFLTLKDIPADQLQALVDRAIQLKQEPAAARQFPQNTLGLVFEKASTRTRVAFEVAVNQLGGSACFITSADSQMGRGEPVADSARVLSQMVDCIAMRCYSHQLLEEFASFSQVPVINALSDDFHPCQLLADIMTFQEQRGAINGARVAWVGDGNNMCHSYMNAARLFDFELRVAAPEGYEPNSQLSLDSENVVLCDNAVDAVSGADLVSTDVWASMGQEQEQKQRELAFADYQVNEALMQHAKDDALFMHCLPAHRGEEVSAGLLDRADSVVWQQAGNRMHSQKALLEFLLGG